jgi:hypothetical protein
MKLSAPVLRSMAMRRLALFMVSVSAFSASSKSMLAGFATTTRLGLVQWFSPRVALTRTVSGP